MSLKTEMAVIIEDAVRDAIAFERKRRAKSLALYVWTVDTDTCEATHVVVLARDVASARKLALKRHGFPGSIVDVVVQRDRPRVFRSATALTFFVEGRRAGELRT